MKLEYIPCRLDKMFYRCVYNVVNSSVVTLVFITDPFLQRPDISNKFPDIAELSVSESKNSTVVKDTEQDIRIDNNTEKSEQSGSISEKDVYEKLKQMEDSLNIEDVKEPENAIVKDVKPVIASKPPIPLNKPDILPKPVLLPKPDKPMAFG